MFDRGIINCTNCGKEIKWVKTIYTNALEGNIKFDSKSNDESVVNSKGIVYCKHCDIANLI